MLLECNLCCVWSSCRGATPLMNRSWHRRPPGSRTWRRVRREVRRTWQRIIRDSTVTAILRRSIVVRRISTVFNRGRQVRCPSQDNFNQISTFNMDTAVSAFRPAAIHYHREAVDNLNLELLEVLSGVEIMVLHYNPLRPCPNTAQVQEDNLGVVWSLSSNTATMVCTRNPP